MSWSYKPWVICHISIELQHVIRTTLNTFVTKKQIFICFLFCFNLLKNPGHSQFSCQCVQQQLSVTLQSLQSCQTGPVGLPDAVIRKFPAFDCLMCSFHFLGVTTECLHVLQGFLLLSVPPDHEASRHLWQKWTELLENQCLISQVNFCQVLFFVLLTQLEE